LSTAPRSPVGVTLNIFADHQGQAFAFNFRKNLKFAHGFGGIVDQRRDNDLVYAAQVMR